MRKAILFSLILSLVTLGVFAQLASWSTGSNSAYTNFPTNLAGQINGIGRFTQLKFHPTNPLKMYTVSPQGGFFASVDGGLNWTVKAGTENLVPSCASVCIDRTNDQIIYLGTGDPNYYSNGSGLYKSTDDGATFLPTTLTNCLVIDVIQSPTAAGTFVAATNKGIYKSTNNGATWTATTATNLRFCDLKQNTALNSQTLYACTQENSSKFYISTDFGSTWTQVTSGITTATSIIQSGGRIGVTAADSSVVYFEAIGGGGIIHKSVNNGFDFTVTKGQSVGTAASPFLNDYDFAGDIGQGNYNNCITVDSTNPAKLWLQSHNTWTSDDSGVTWRQLTHWASKVHTDMHEIRQSPYDANKLYSCNDGGIFLSTDGGNNWNPTSNGLYAFEIHNNTGKGSNTDKDLVVVGTQDNGKNFRNTTSWNCIGAGDDTTPKEYDYLPDGGYFYEQGQANRRRISPAGSTPTGFPTGGGNWKKLAFNPTNTDLGFMWSTDNNLYRTTNLSANTPTWLVVGAFTSEVMDMHNCVADANRLYVITKDGKVLVSTNALSATPTFTSVTLPSSSSTIASITAIANNANTVYISIDMRVYVSTDAGATWADISYNLPNVNHRKIISEKFGGTQELVFVATNNAVYYKKAGQLTWTNYSTKLPSRRSPTDFNMYDDGTNQARLRFYTFGRGAWETPFDNLRALTAQINTVGSKNITCSNPTIQYTDGSIGTYNTPITYAWSFPGGTPSTSSAPNPAVSYATTGTYAATLTVTDALNNVSSKTITNFIQVITCAPDTIPGAAISISGSSNYATIPSVNLGNTNTVTMSAWIKINVAQPSFAGVLAVAGGTATSLNFMSGNRIGYTWNDNPATYNYTRAPIIANDVWTHVALVVTPTNATVYVNGVGYTNTVANTPHNFAGAAFNLGNDRNNQARTMTGLLDEVCIYNRALSQSEIRELMHLTRNQAVTDPSLLHYYQCNEVGTIVYDRSGSTNAVLRGTATHLTSTAPVGGGTSSRQTITTSGTNNFVNEGVALTFGSGNVPNGEICVTRLNAKPDEAPTGFTLDNTGSKYWVVNNYGTNSTFTTSVNTSAIGFGAISTPDAVIPSAFKIHQRNTGDFGAGTWNLLDSASTAVAGANGSLSFTGANNTRFNKQFVITKTIIDPFDITATTDTNGTVTPVGVTRVEAGTSQTYTITPNACYQIATVLVDGVNNPAAVSSGTYTFSNVTATHTISATFTRIGVSSNFAPIPAFCSGTTAPILATTSPNGVEGTWSPATINNLASGSYVFTPTSGCNTGQTLEVTVTPSLTSDFAPIPAFCSGTTAPTLATTAPNGVTGTWSPATINNLASGSYVFTPTSGCNTGQTLVVRVNEIPATPTITAASSTTFCFGGSVILSSSAASGNSWYLDGQLVGSSQSINASTPGIYTVKVSSSGCESLVSAGTTVTAVSEAINSSVALTSGVLRSNQAGATYQWYRCPSTIIPSATTQSYTPTEQGDYKVVVTAARCSVTSDCITVATLGINEFDESTFGFYPNPVDDILTISYSEELTSIKVTNTSGQQLITKKLQSKTAKIDMSHLPSGTYLVEVTAGDGSKTIKVLKM